MILYQNPIAALERAGKALLRVNPEAPVAASARRAVEALITPEWLAGRDHVRALDIGSRDGKVTAEMQAVIAERSPPATQTPSFFGLDPLQAAVDTRRADLSVDHVDR